MKKISIRKTIICVTLMVAMLSMGSIAYADTTDFSLTVNNTATNEDNFSKRTKKAGGASYENKAYVRATSFSTVGTIYVQSVKLGDISIHTPEIGLGSNNTVNVLQSASYKIYAPSDQYYYLQGRFGGSITSNSMRVVGRYTP